MFGNEEWYTLKIQFDKISDVKEFSAISDKSKGKVIVISSNNYIADGRSLLGLFGLDLSEPVQIEVANEDDYYTIFDFCQKKGLIT